MYGLLLTLGLSLLIEGLFRSVYGVSGLFYEGANAHGMNEHISSKAFYEGLEFMYRLVRKLSAGPGM